MSPGAIGRSPRPALVAMLGAFVLLTVGPAFVHGVLSGRWKNAADLSLAARKLEMFPREFGDWKQQGEEEQLPVEAVRELQCAGYFNRHYVNQRLGRDVTIMMMVGPSGPLIRHPPEICYGNRANTLVSDPVSVDLKTADSRQHSFRLLRYKNPAAASGEFSVCYGWTEDGNWSVPTYPRLRFGGAPMLYKIQVLTTDTVPNDGGFPVAADRFLEDFLPRWRETAFAGG